MVFPVTEQPQYINNKPPELRAQQIIMKAYNVSIIEDDDTEGRTNFAEYDFRTSDDVTYEFKNDIRSLATGNFFITFQQKFLNGYGNWVLAGLSTTTADYWILTYGESLYIFPTVIMRKLIEKHKYKTAYYTTERGDRINGHLLQVKHIKPYAIILNSDLLD